MHIKNIEHSQAVTFLEKNFSSPTHWPDWNLLISKYFNTKFKYFGLYKNKKLVGIFPFHETNQGILKSLNSGQFQYIPNGGWITNNITLINVSTIPLPINARLECFSLPELKEFGAKYSNFANKSQTLIVSLNNDEDHIWMKSIDSKRRNMIRKAQKNNVIIKNAANNFDVFYDIYHNANKRYGLTNLPKSFFMELLKTGMNICFDPLVAFVEGEPQAVLGLIYDKHYAFYWLGASREKAKNMGQGELLQWEAIRKAKNFGCKYYDLCYIEKKKLPNIYEFKKGFSQNMINIHYISKKTIFFRIFNKLKNTFLLF